MDSFWHELPGPRLPADDEAEGKNQSGDDTGSISAIPFYGIRNLGSEHGEVADILLNVRLLGRKNRT